MASRTSTHLAHPARADLQLAHILAALGDPLRLGIVAHLGSLTKDAELPCVAFELPVSKSTQSGHFRVLREAGLIRQRDEGTRRLNRLRWDDVEDRFPGLLQLAVNEGWAHIPDVVRSSP